MPCRLFSSRQYFVAGFASLILLIAFFCGSLAFAAGMNVVSVHTGKGEVRWSVELASDDASRSRGLMFRKTMTRRSGMLFRFDETGPVAMWMKNTFIPLDMIFADERGTVTHIHQGAVPQSLDIISSRGPARFVLEVNAGEADNAGISVGNHLLHPWFLPIN